MLLEENQILGWVLKKSVKWHKLQKRLQHRQVKWLVEKLREAESEMEVSICGPEQGEILGEEDNGRLAKDLMDYWNSSE